MIFLISCFFIISPLVILYTAGYRYDKSTHKIKETGVITIDIAPRDAVVSLNDVVIDQRIPIHLQNRAPGFYKLHIFREGYLPWSMPIEVASKQTTYITDSALYKDVLPTFEYTTPENQIETHVSPDAQYVATIVQDEGAFREILLYDIEKNTEQVVWRGTSELPLGLSWSPYAPIFSFFIARQTGNLVQMIDARTPADATTYTLTNATSTEIQWSETRRDTMYLLDENQLFAMSGGSTNLLEQVTSTYHWYIDGAQDIWTLDDTTHALYKNSILVQSFSTMPATYSILGITGRYALIQTDQMDFRMLWLDSGESTTLNATHAFRIKDPAEPAGWIVWSPWEVFSIDDNGSQTLITRTNKALFDVTWSSLHKSLLFVFEGGIIVGFHPQYRTSQELFHYQHAWVNSISIDDTSSFIIFESSLNDKRGIYKREL